MVNMSEDNKKFSLTTVLVWIGATASVCAGAGWTVGRSLINDELEQYKKSESWKLPETIASIQSLSGSLDIKLKKINDYDELVKKKNELEIDVKTLTINQSNLNKGIQGKNIEINKLKKIIEVLRGEEIIIKEGESFPVGHKSLKVGVTYIDTLYKNASVTSGDYTNPAMKVGDNFKRIIGSSRYVVTLTGIAEGYASFSFDISDEK